MPPIKNPAFYGIQREQMPECPNKNYECCSTFNLLRLNCRNKERKGTAFSSQRSTYTPMGHGFHVEGGTKDQPLGKLPVS